MDNSLLNSKIFDEGWLSVAAPPINNACLPTIYDKLDADARARVKVVNRMLDKQHDVQDKIIYKYKDQALRHLQQNKIMVERDLERILRKYPNMDELPFLSFNLTVSKRKESRSRSLSKFKAYSTEAIGMKGLSEERSDDPFCERYYGHHIGGFRVGRNPPRKLDPIPPKENKVHISRPLILSKRLSSSDHLLNTRLRLFCSNRPIEEDAMTV